MSAKNAQSCAKDKEIVQAHTAVKKRRLPLEWNVPLSSERESHERA
jgi:hypothetical protein